MASGQTAAHVVERVDGELHRRRLDFVDVLRALAVLAVFSLHVRGNWVTYGTIGHHSPLFLLDRVFAQGAAGVDLFIVLSGFCLTYPLIRGRPVGVARISTRRFYKRRAFRILPACYASIILLVALENVHATSRYLVSKPPTGWDVLAHALLVQPFVSSVEGTINGPLWSISLEVTLYLLFPVTLLMRKRFGWRPLVGAAFALAVVWSGIAAVADAAASHSQWLPNFQHLLPEHYFEFVLGMVAAELVCRPRSWQRRAAILAMVVGVPIGGAGAIASIDLVRILGWGVAAFGLTLFMSGLAIFQRTQHGFAVRALIRLGVVSYSFYLLHQPFLLLLRPAVGHVTHSAAGLYLAAVPAVAMMFGVAWMFFRLVERPFLVSGGMRDAILRDEEADKPGIVTPGAEVATGTAT